MDTSTKWPWDWEEEAEWKAELEERDYEFFERLIDSAFEETEVSSEYALGIQSEAAVPENNSVAA